MSILLPCFPRRSSYLHSNTWSPCQGFWLAVLSILLYVISRVHGGSCHQDQGVFLSWETSSSCVASNCKNSRSGSKGLVGNISDFSSLSLMVLLRRHFLPKCSRTAHHCRQLPEGSSRSARPPRKNLLRPSAQHCCCSNPLWRLRLGIHESRHSVRSFIMLL